MTEKYPRPDGIELFSAKSDSTYGAWADWILQLESEKAELEGQLAGVSKGIEDAVRVAAEFEAKLQAIDDYCVPILSSAEYGSEVAKVTDDILAMIGEEP